MPRPPRKSFWRWTPLPYLLLILLLLTTGSLADAGADAAYRVLLVITIVVAAAMIAALLVSWRHRPPQFDSAGRLRSLEGIELLAASAAGGHPITVAEVSRHQNGIDYLHAWGGEHVTAVLLPAEDSWWGLRLRTAVYLVAGERLTEAGRLPDRAQLTWDAALQPLRRDGRLVAVPATITGTHRPFGVDLDLAGLESVLPASVQSDAAS